MRVIKKKSKLKSIGGGEGGGEGGRRRDIVLKQCSVTSYYRVSIIFVSLNKGLKK